MTASVGTAALLLAPSAFAADAAAGEAAAAPSSSSVTEIVVTANKLNSSKVLEVPGAIQALSGAALQKAGAVGFLDIANQIPGLAVQDLGPGDRKYIIRGVSSTGASTTGVYYDEAVISGANANDGGGFESDIRSYDIDHIEVLRGPQGTLYGADSMSGTIRFITNKPNLNDFGGYLTAEASDTNHGGGNYDFNGEVNLPIIADKVALRVVGWTLNDSGYINQDRVGAGSSPTDTTGSEIRGVNNDIVQGGRVALRVQPTDNFTIDASFSDQSEYSGGSSRYTPTGVAGYPIPGAAASQGCDLCNTDVTRSPWSDNLQVFSLTGTYKFQYGTLTATTNQYNRKLDFNFDSTPDLISYKTPYDAETQEPQTRDVNSSEIRYASDFDFPVNFVAGVYRQYETDDLSVHVLGTNADGEVISPFSTSPSANPLLNGNPYGGGSFFGRIDDRTTTEYAGFGEATWKVTSKLTLVAGLRYFTETLGGFGQTTQAFGAACTSATCSVNPYPSQSASKVTFKFNGSYKFNDQLLVYATAAQGFRGGGINAPQFLGPKVEDIPESFKPDSLWNYEVGAKGKLFNGKLDYQIDAYAIFWYGIQVAETTQDGLFSYTGNAGNAVVKGLEFEFDAHPIQHLTASFSGSYTDSYLSEGATPFQYAANNTLGLTGESLPEVAPEQFNVGLNYTAPLPMATDWKGTLAGDITYRSAENSYFTSNPYNIPLRPYTLLNVRAGLATGLWSATLFIRNLTDDRAQVSAINSSQDPEALLTVQPRTVGVSVTRTF